MNLLYILRKDRCRDGLVQIILRITINKKRSHYETGVLVRTIDWNQKMQMITSKAYDSSNRKLLALREKVEGLYEKDPHATSLEVKAR